MIFRSKSPLRIGLAGGGTDVSPYSDEFGGSILNATINMYAYATLRFLDDEDKIILQAKDSRHSVEYDVIPELPINGKLNLLKGVYNRIVKDYDFKPRPLKLTTYVDAPPGSGLGSSSTLVVAIIGAFVEALKLPLGEYDIAQLAYDIERKDLAMAGGKQDQYAATFGGFNFMEFYGEKVVVNPLRIKDYYILELQFNTLLFYTKTSRVSSEIIESQVKNVREKSGKSIEAMHKLKEQAIWMKEAILKGELNKIGEILDFGWQHKKKMASGITNPMIDDLYEAAKRAGATGGKISGAGGGGFMIFYCPGNTRYTVLDELKAFNGNVNRFEFTDYGLATWSAIS